VVVMMVLVMIVTMRRAMRCTASFGNASGRAVEQALQKDIRETGSTSFQSLL